MSGGAVAAGVLCAALGLLLGLTGSRRALWTGLGAVVLTAGPASLANLDPAAGEWAARACWAGALATAACAHLPGRVLPRLSLLLCLIGGGLAGAAASVGTAYDIVAALPWALSALPGAWLTARGRGLVLKIVLSWLAAAAALSLGLLMTPTLGFEPDHMG